MNILKVSHLLLVATILLFGCQTAGLTEQAEPQAIHIDTYQPSYSVQTRAVKNTPDFVTQIVQGLRDTMVANISSIWHNYNWDALQVLLVYPSKAQSYLWIVRPDSLMTVKNKALDRSVQAGDFLYIDHIINGKQTLLLNLEAPMPWVNSDAEKIEFVVGLGSHENFHFVAQKNWIFRAESSGDRGTSYPRAALPRLYRHMLYRALVSYWKSSGNYNDISVDGTAPGLRHARYWYDRWKSEFPNEWKNSTDITEGTARYVEDMTTAIMKVKAANKDISEANLREFLIQRTQDALLVPSAQDIIEYGAGSALSLDTEGYTLGTLAVYILRFDTAGLGLSLEKWNSMVSNGSSPLEIILQNFQPLKQTVDAELQAILESRILTLNQQLAPIYDLLIAQWQDPSNYVRVRMPSIFIYNAGGNLRPKDFGYLKAIDQWAVQFPGDPHQLVSPNAGKTTIQVNDGYIDKDGDIIVMLPRSLFENQTETVQVVDILADSSVSDPVNGKLVGRLLPAQNGASYFMAE